MSNNYTFGKTQYSTETITLNAGNSYKDVLNFNPYCVSEFIVINDSEVNDLTVKLEGPSSDAIVLKPKEFFSSEKDTSYFIFESLADVTFRFNGFKIFKK